MVVYKGKNYADNPYGRKMLKKAREKNLEKKRKIVKDIKEKKKIQIKKKPAPKAPAPSGGGAAKPKKKVMIKKQAPAPSGGGAAKPKKKVMIKKQAPAPKPKPKAPAPSGGGAAKPKLNLKEKKEMKAKSKLKKKKLILKINKPKPKAPKTKKAYKSELEELTEHLNESIPKNTDAWEEWLEDLKDIFNNLLRSDAPYNLSFLTSGTYLDKFPIVKKLQDFQLTDDEYLYDSFQDIMEIRSTPSELKRSQLDVYKQDKIIDNFSKVEESGRIGQIEELMRIIETYNYLMDMASDKQNKWSNNDPKIYTPIIKEITKYFKKEIGKYQSRYDAGRTNENMYYFQNWKRSSLGSLPKTTEQAINDIIDPSTMRLSKQKREDLNLGGWDKFRYLGKEQKLLFREAAEDELNFLKRQFPKPF